ncbi:MAG: hypothetical protein JWO57_451 [Pseudonocardiales bacterium]|nr:hypothetical protein [Pseudonocardiales bacterium]
MVDANAGHHLATRRALACRECAAWPGKVAKWDGPTGAGKKDTATAQIDSSARDTLHRGSRLSRAYRG